MSIYDRFRLDGQVAVVTRGGRGIGRGIALAFAECGADVVVLARRQQDVDAVAREVEERGRRGLGGFRWDVRAERKMLLRLRCSSRRQQLSGPPGSSSM